MKTYEPRAGEDISRTAKQMVALANCVDDTVKTEFNGVELKANPSKDEITAVAVITAYYHNESSRRAEEYVNSPKYKKWQREAEEAQRRQDLILKGALSVAPEKMTLRDEEGWKKTVAANTYGYGGGIIRYAERWARLMEVRMANGATLEACADKTSSLVNNESITGFMYGCAVSILSQVWIHGEELRRWHNLKTQIGHEGEKANASGGVLNPALLSLR